MEFFHQRANAIAGGAPPPPLGLYILNQERFIPAFQSRSQNFNQNRLRVIAALYQKP